MRFSQRDTLVPQALKRNCSPEARVTMLAYQPVVRVNSRACSSESLSSRDLVRQQDALVPHALRRTCCPEARVRILM
jgi:hypothetical protein